MSEYTDESKMPFGKYKGRTLGDVPDEYLLWLYGDMSKDVFSHRKKSFSHEDLFQYLQDNLDAIKLNLNIK